MELNLLLGAGFVLLAAACNGTLALPQKFVKGFAWENTWGAFYLFAMVLVPAVVALLFLKGGPATWHQAGLVQTIIPIAFGFLWGCGMACFGMGIEALGISLGYAIIMGLSVLVGSVVPLLSQHAAEVFTTAGLLAVAGIVTCTAGVAVCGRAGALRGRSLVAEDGQARPRAGHFAKGLAICILAGVLGASINLAFCYAGQIVRLSEQAGNSPPVATLSAWILVFWGGFLVTGPYCAYLLTKNATWKNFAGPHACFDLTMAAIMGILHFLILFLYGIGAYYLGNLGTSVGWAACLSCGLLIANLVGFMTGEWRGASRQSRQWLLAGLGILVLGMCILGAANWTQLTPDANIRATEQ
jgi:L-rhamnose-H+ transport protein